MQETSSTGVKYLWVRDLATGAHYSQPVNAIDPKKHKVLKSVPEHNFPKRTKHKIDLKKDNKASDDQSNESPDAGNEEEG